MTKYPVPLTVIARRAGTKPSHISKILRGRGAREETLRKVSRAMGLTMDEFRDQFPKSKSA